MLLDMTDFNVVLKMNWLASCHATLDCHNKAVKFNMFGELVFSFQGDRSEALSNLISMLSAQRSLRKGCHGYLAFVRYVEKDVVNLKQVTIIREFLDVFPIELSGLPPDREIELNIDVVLGTQPIFVPPCRMAPTELKELKDQLQDLLDKDFIRASLSP